MNTQGILKRSNRGQSIVELAIFFPIFLLMFAGIVDFGLYFLTAHEVQNASREGGRIAASLPALEVNDPRVLDRVTTMLPDNGFLSDVTSTSSVPDCTVDEGELVVTVTANYNFTFLNILGLNSLGMNIPTTMRHESCGGTIAGGGGGDGADGGTGGIFGDDAICFALTTDHTGNGADPELSPEASADCANGYFYEGAVITLTADPDLYWEVDNWEDSDDDTSRSNTNQVTMPAEDAHVIVNYVLVPCYPLTLSKIGNGAVPTAPPTGAPHCAAGEYVEHESVTLTAVPNVDHAVSNWSGTDDDSSFSDENTLTMPGSDHVASVTYIQLICYSLATSHTGNGNDPTPSAANCSGGRYIENTVVTLNAQPDAGWLVASWNNTNNDSSASSSNSVTMTSDKSVTVNYEVETEVGPPVSVYIPEGPGEWEWSTYWRVCRRLDLRWSDNPAWTESPVYFEVFRGNSNWGSETDYHWNANHWIRLGEQITLGVRAVFPGGKTSQIQEVTYICFWNDIQFWGSVIK